MTSAAGRGSRHQPQDGAAAAGGGDATALRVSRPAAA